MDPPDDDMTDDLLREGQRKLETVTEPEEKENDNDDDNDLCLMLMYWFYTSGSRSP